MTLIQCLYNTLMKSQKFNIIKYSEISLEISQTSVKILFFKPRNRPHTVMRSFTIFLNSRYIFNFLKLFIFIFIYLIVILLCFVKFKWT